MNHKSLRAAFLVGILIALLPAAARAQQTLGSINGTVTDTSGGVVQGATVKVHKVDTGLEQTATTKNDGSFSIVDLPIGTYSVTLTKGGFKTDVHPRILVRGNTTTTVNASLQPGEVSSTVTVTATPLLNQTDTTNGYTLSPEVIEAIPLGTGSFTQLAILAPGVNADFLSGSGTNAGLGNQAIWANGQRDTSNSITFNGVNANNVFNGKTSSEVAGNRFVLNTGENFLGGQGEDIQTNTSVYSAIGQGLPTPPPETIQEVHVNTSMYDASQGANSGAHVELTTKSGTNNFHGQVYEYHQTDAWNAAPFFRNADISIAQSDKVPKLHYNRFGGDFGGPIIHDKLFFYGSYQGQRITDQLNASSALNVPLHLTDMRDPTSLANAANMDFNPTCGPGQTPPNPCLMASQIDPVAAAIMQAKLPDGSFLIPSPTITDINTISSVGHDVLLQGVSRFLADQANGNIDYNFGSKDRLAAKYYYQRDPNSSPFAIASVQGFTQTLKAGSQVISLDNTTILTPNLTWEQRGGFIRERAFATTNNAFTPSSFGINVFGSKFFPGIFIDNTSGTLPTFGNLGIGPTSNFANAGVFQNQWEGASNLSWVHGRHTITTGFNWDYNQLNIVNNNNQVGAMEFSDFLSFLQGQFRIGPEHTFLLNGATNRYYRSNQVGAYGSDNIKLTPNLTVTVGLRWDWDGPLSEKHGLLSNFYPQNYQYNLACDTGAQTSTCVTNIGLVVAGNNKQFCATKSSFCVDNSTLTGRQWIFGPRVGLAWSPSFMKNFVVRAGFGIYADRGEFFTELSPSAGFGISGPFGVTVEPPFVVPCLPGPTPTGCGAGANNPTFANPYGTSPPPPPPNNLSGVIALVPNQNGFTDASGVFHPGLIQGATPFFFGGYDPRSKLPYSENWTLDLQWQPWNTVVFDVAYVGNHAQHLTMPVPFNEPGIATATNSINGQTSSYGYQVPGFDNEPFNTATGGNTDLRVPFIGYNPNSDFNKAIGISNYHALQFQVTKRLSYGLQINGSYTWSHALDEQSGLGLFYNGNDPNNPKSAYASSDFDRTHVFIVSYLYQLPKSSHLTGFWDKVVNGWGISGVTVLQSGQPYSVIDFSGAVASIFFSTNDFITNPIVPVGGLGATSGQVSLQGTTGVNAGKPVLNVNAFGIPLLQPGQDGVPLCDSTGCDTFETGFGATGRNIVRGPFQTRFDFSVTKNFRISERFNLKYDAQFFNIFNHPSFDTPNNNVAFNPFFANPPNVYGFPGFPACVPATGAYNCPPSGSLGIIQHTLGSPRFVQMALHLTF